MTYLEPRSKWRFACAAKPWSESGFQSAWGKATTRAGIRGLTFHDLRGTAVVTLARAGCNEVEIYSITGGEVLKLLENWRGASFADENQQTGFGEPGKGAPHGNENTCFAAHA